MVALMNETETLREFREFEKVNGPAFIWGQVSSPYEGCFHLNVIAFVRGKYAFVTSDLKDFAPYKQYVVSPPKELADIPQFRAGCILARDLDAVVDRAEIHPLADLTEQTAYALTRSVLLMGSELGYDMSGLFKCPLCGVDLADYADQDAEYSICFLESEYHGAGGLAVDVGAPVCYECYGNRHCSYCGEECEPEQQGVDEDGRCIWCAKPITCAHCGEEVSLAYNSTEEDIAAYRAGFCAECHEEQERAKVELARYAKIENQTGDLFASQV